ncbi:MAG: hypothetical protein U9Q82_01220 [Chloroflexota bacterium]|nr:hypothetical protein [Chloroflexota bacterium]
MQEITIKLKQPVSQFVEHQSQKRRIPHQETIIELVTMGFESLLRDRYRRYRQGEISFGRLAHELGITTWELSHLLDERDWPAYNLPAATGSKNK